jgi:hypothetical protein
MNLSDTARIRILSVQRAIVYDDNSERAEKVAEVLRGLDLEPLLIDHSALMRAIIQAPNSPPALLIGDVEDCDWAELGAALREQLGDVPVVAYGSSTTAQHLAPSARAFDVCRSRSPRRLWPPLCAFRRRPRFRKRRTSACPRATRRRCAR